MDGSTRELGLQNAAYTLLQEKDGIRVARVWRQGAPYIIKFFQAADFAGKSQITGFWLRWACPR